MSDDGLPRYEELPARPGAPAGSSWGVFGDDDQLGMFNLLTQERAKDAARLVRKGRVFPLNLELHLPDPPLFEFRKPMQHDVFCIPDSFEIAWDDRVDLAPQGSSQWDGLTHVKDPEAGFYNGVQVKDVTGKEGTKNGIEHWARKGIVGRAVLLDYARFMQRSGKSYDALGPTEISLDDLKACIEAQSVELRPGDVLLLRTGWLTAYRELSAAGRKKLAEEASCAGIKPTDPFPRFFWENRIPAIAADNISVERWPLQAETGFLHIAMIAHLGMALGEMWDLDALAKDCEEDGVYECMLVSAPLNLRGGVGSPPNATAIK